MTQQEKINQAINTYTWIFTHFGGYSEDAKQAFEYVFKQVFRDGIEWAEENPPQDVINLNDIWHPVTKQPIGKDWKILCEDKSDCYWVESKCSLSPFYSNWQKYAEDVELNRWAYISDLLPKGGKK